MADYSKLAKGLGVGLLGILGIKILDSLINGDDDKRKKKIFISFAFEDKQFRDYLVFQARDNRSPFTFIDMSVRRAWDDRRWKRECKRRIRECDGVIVMLSNHSYHSGALRWEARCANELDIPLIGMHIRKRDKYSIPPELDSNDVIEWSWENLDNFINSIN